MPYKNIEDARRYRRNYQKIKGHEIYLKNRDKIIEKNKLYRSKNKSKIVEYQAKWREQNRENLRKYARNYYYNNHTKYVENRNKSFFKLKLDVLNAYSNNSPRCTCCGESEIDFLQIDHINGGGNKSRKDKNRFGTSYYFYLRKNNYPTGYQILCANCNHAKGRLGVCPHKKLNVDGAIHQNQ